VYVTLCGCNLYMIEKVVRVCGLCIMLARYPFEMFFVSIVSLNYFPMKLATCLPAQAQGNVSRHHSAVIMAYGLINTKKMLNVIKVETV
jgi:hypothetical protein